MASVSETDDKNQHDVEGNLSVVADQVDDAMMVSKLAEIVLGMRSMTDLVHELSISENAITKLMAQHKLAVRKQMVLKRHSGEVARSRATQLLDQTLDQIEVVLGDPETSPNVVLKSGELLNKLSGSGLRTELVEKAKAGGPATERFVVTINLGGAEPQKISGEIINHDELEVLSGDGYE